MRILLISPYFPPQNAVASLRIHAFASTWAKSGETVTVLTTTKRADQRGLDLRFDGFEVVELDCRVPRWLEILRGRHKSNTFQENGRLPLSSSHQSNRLFSWLLKLKERTGVFGSVRMPDLTDYWVRPAIEWCRAQAKHESHWDVVVSSSGPYTAHLAAMAIKRLGLADRWVADFRDLWTGNHIFRGLFPFTLRERWLEQQCLCEADLIVTVSEGLARTLRRRSGRTVEVIYNGFDSTVSSASHTGRSKPRDGMIRVVYTGTLYPQGQDPSPLLQAMALVRTRCPDAAARLRLIVAGQGVQTWIDLARRFDVQQMVEAHGRLSRTEALDLQQSASALLLLDWNDPDKGVLTGKVFEYLSASAPILVVSGVDTSPLAHLLRRTGRGIHLGSNQRRIVSALIDLFDDPSALATTANAELIATFSREHQSLRLLEMMRGLCARVERQD